MMMVSIGIVVCVFLPFTIVLWHRKPWPRVGHGDGYFRSAEIQGHGDGYFRSAEVRTEIGP